MANTFTADTHIDPMTVTGNMRMVAGTLTMTDGGAGSSVASGLDYIYGGSVTAKTATTQMGGAVYNSNVDGDFKAQSCSSGDTFHVLLFGR